jgi:hypothetical protein
MNYQPQFDPYVHLRQVVEPGLAMLPAMQLREHIDSSLGEGTADAVEGDLENIFGGIGRAISSAAHDVGHFAQHNAGGLAQIGGGIIQGAMAGSAAGLPGIIAGAAVGGTGAGLRTYGKGTARDVGNALGTVTNLAGQFSPLGRVGATIGPAVGNIGGALASGGGRGGAAAIGQALPGIVSGIAGAGGGGGAAGGGAGGMAGALFGAAPQIAGSLASLFGGSSAAGQLASAINRPEIQQALGAMRLGSMGRPSIPVGPANTPVPTGQFAQMLSQLLGQAAQEWSDAAGEGAELAEVDFMRDGAGEFAGDPSNPSDRSARLWTMLNAAQGERFGEALAWETERADAEGNFESDTDSSDFGSDAAYWDSVDRAEADALNDQLDAAFDMEGMDYA